MMAKLIASVIDELQTTTDLLVVTNNRLDLERMELAVAARERAISRLSDLVARHANSFTPQDLERVRILHAKGKQAVERLVQTRRDGWTTATELDHDSYILKSFSQFRTPSE